MRGSRREPLPDSGLADEKDGLFEQLVECLSLICGVARLGIPTAEIDCSNFRLQGDACTRLLRALVVPRLAKRFRSGRARSGPGESPSTVRQSGDAAPPDHHDLRTGSAVL